MKTEGIVREIELNQQKIDSYGKWDDSILKKINYRFRLDWNYFSNRMEGGALTREETRSVMVGNIDVKGKPLKDVMEMNGHDRMVLDILKMGKGEQRISEKRIKEIHKSIMHEDDPEKSGWIGHWKTVDNHVYSYKNEKIEFTPHQDVKDKIHQLLNNTNVELEKYFTGKSSKHPIEIATNFHVDFVTIHPFYDGNGRMTRILSNLILISCGLPPIVIKDQHKKSYYQLLADVQVYGGEVDLFVKFIGERVLESQGLVLAVLNGEEIEEGDDIDKEIDLFIRKLEIKESLTMKMTEELVVKIYDNSLKPLLCTFLDKHEKFDKLFDEKIVRSTINNHTAIVGLDGIGYFDKWVDYTKQKIELNTRFDGNAFKISELSKIKNLEDLFKYEKFGDIHGIFEIELAISYQGFKQNGVNAFNIYSGLIIIFNPYSYEIKSSKTGEKYNSKLYSQELTKTEINKIITEILRETLAKIQDSMN